MNEITYYLGKKIVKSRFLYWFLNFTWGILSTLIGYMMLILLLPFGKVHKHNGTLYLELMTRENAPYAWGFSMGTVFFVNKYGTHIDIANHEYGHTVQNAIFGPFMPFLVYIPSVLRFWYRSIFKVTTPAYISVWFEHTATKLGEYCYYKRNLW